MAATNPRAAAEHPSLSGEHSRSSLAAQYRPRFENPHPLPPVSDFGLDHILSHIVQPESASVAHAALVVNKHYQTDLRHEIRQALVIEQKIQHLNIRVAKVAQKQDKRMQQNTRRVARGASQKGKSVETDVELLLQNSAAVSEKVMDIGHRINARGLRPNKSKYPRLARFLEGLKEPAVRKNAEMSFDGEPLERDQVKVGEDKLEKKPCDKAGEAGPLERGCLLVSPVNGFSRPDDNGLVEFDLDGNGEMGTAPLGSAPLGSGLNGSAPLDGSLSVSTNASDSPGASSGAFAIDPSLPRASQILPGPQPDLPRLPALRDLPPAPQNHNHPLHESPSPFAMPHRSSLKEPARPLSSSLSSHPPSQPPVPHSPPGPPDQSPGLATPPPAEMDPAAFEHLVDSNIAKFRLKHAPGARVRNPIRLLYSRSRISQNMLSASFPPPSPGAAPAIPSPMSTTVPSKAAATVEETPHLSLHKKLRITSKPLLQTLLDNDDLWSSSGIYTETDDELSSSLDSSAADDMSQFYSALHKKMRAKRRRRVHRAQSPRFHPLHRTLQPKKSILKMGRRAAPQQKPAPYLASPRASFASTEAAGLFVRGAVEASAVGPGKVTGSGLDRLGKDGLVLDELDLAELGLAESEHGLEHLRHLGGLEGLAGTGPSSSSTTEWEYQTIVRLRQLLQ